MSNPLFPKGALVLCEGHLGPDEGYGVVLTGPEHKFHKTGISREGSSMGDNQEVAHWSNKCFTLICNINHEIL